MAKDYDDEIDLEQTGGFGKEAVAEAAKRPTYSPSTESAEAPKKQSFGQAFAAARKAGDRTFMFNGKKYTTELKSEAKKPTVTPKAEPAKAEPAKAEPAKAEPAKTQPSRSRISQAKGSMAEKMRALGITRYKSGGSVSASKRADGCAVRGKTRGKVL
jgi:hypothetical protein